MLVLLTANTTVFLLLLLCMRPASTCITKHWERHTDFDHRISELKAHMMQAVPFTDLCCEHVRFTYIGKYVFMNICFTTPVTDNSRKENLKRSERRSEMEVTGSVKATISAAWYLKDRGVK